MVVSVHDSEGVSQCWRRPTRVAMMPGGSVVQFCWHDLPCFACRQPIGTPDPQQRLCADCNEEWGRILADLIDPAGKYQTVEQAIGRLLGNDWLRG